MESLALVVSLIMLVVLVSGPSAVIVAKYGNAYVGGLLGGVALLLGFWCLGVNPAPIFYILGTVESFLGAWAIKSAIKRVRGT